MKLCCPRPPREFWPWQMRAIVETTVRARSRRRWKQAGPWSSYRKGWPWRTMAADGIIAVDLRPAEIHRRPHACVCAW